MQDRLLLLELLLAVFDIKTKAVFPDEDSVFKLIYLAMNNISKRWSRPIKNWKAALSHFAILFPERFML
jgi:putative transposase